VLGVSDGREY